ncbi:hypothetical protein ABZ729_37205 [Streptomyces sp. NPDC006678]|uniref:hypothetical protein n=1 Tax=Streptomyces sp. NPDC006678 TaxID=3157185 RepID=UPI00340C1061
MAAHRRPRLTHQAKTVTDPASGAMVIRSVVDTLEAHAALTPTTTKTSRKDRTDPAPDHTPRAQATQGTLPGRPPGPAGQRPEGHAHTGRRLLPAQPTCTGA